MLPYKLGGAQGEKRTERLLMIIPTATIVASTMNPLIWQADSCVTGVQWD